MRRTIFATIFALCALAGAPQVRAQATSAASKTFQISAFGGLTGTYTGLNGGKNLGITAGVDLGFRSYFGLTPSAEFRGTFAVDKGTVDSQKNALGGLRVEKSYGHLHPYADILYGRGQINYGANGYPSPVGDFSYADTTSNVLSPGVGGALYLDRHLAVFADVQFQHYDTPVTPSGSLWAKALTAGVIYRFNFEHHGNPGPYYGR